MEWAQVLAIVLPVMLAIVIGSFFNNSRLNDMNRRFDDVNQRFAEINQRLMEMSQEIHGLKDLMIQFLQRESGYKINRVKDGE